MTAARFATWVNNDLQYRAATSSKKLVCTHMHAAAACAPNYMHMRVHSVQCNVNLATTCEGLQLTVASACEYSSVYFELVASQYCTLLTSRLSP